jgi:uncharacterized protein (TIGR02145 family)
MKKFYTLFTLFLSLLALAQTPQGFNYQATVRNSSGALIVNQDVNLKFNLMQNSPTNEPVYSETHDVTTDDLGQVNLVIGQGTATSGTFSEINWGTGNYYMGIELNTGNGYVSMGTTQLLSVPYALYALNAGNTQTPVSNLASVLAVNNGANNLQIKNLADPTDAQDAVTNHFLASQIANLQAQITALQNANVAQLHNVTIGTQIWTTKNLDITTYRDGTPIPQVSDPTAWAALTTGAWCYYNNDSGNGTTYGKLYNWYAVAGINDNASLSNPSLRKQFAPIGWHVPSDEDWTTLMDFLGSEAGAGGMMKETGTAHWLSPNTEATNSSGFTVLPGGYRYNNGEFATLGTSGNLWSTLEDSSNAYYRGLNYNNASTYRNFYSKKFGFSVRCIRD